EIELDGTGDLRVRAQPVHRDPGSDEVEVGGGVEQGAGGLGDVPDLGPDAGVGRLLECRAEDLELLAGDGAVRLVGAGEVRPDADHVHSACGLSTGCGVEEFAEVLRACAAAALAGVDLGVESGRAAGAAGGGGEFL